MSTALIKKYRPASLIFSAFGITSAVICLSLQHNGFFLASALIAFTSISFFLFTEAFLFQVPTRSKLNIWLARFFFVLSIPVVLSIAVALLAGTL